METTFLVCAFAGVFLAMFRSLGWGFLAVIAVGYFNGVIRANYLGLLTTFMFDAAVLGLYVGLFFRKSLWADALSCGLARYFVVFLIAWPTLLCFLPVNHILVQCVALRAAIWFLPVLLIATRLTTADLAVIARGLVVLNLMAFAVGVYLYVRGVEALYPVNAITQIMYRSKDLGGSTKFHRIPSTFLNAHAYGGTMLLSLPFLLDRLAGVNVRVFDRWLAAAGVVAAAAGLLMCGARSPLIVLGVAMVIAYILTRASLKIGLIISALAATGLYVAGGNERLQRATTLGDSDYVSQRIAGSVNTGFLELALKYPLGAGMGTAAGTNMPYFLLEVTPQQIGMENEYSRILVDQGWFGLAGWLGLLGWLHLPPSAQLRVPWWLGVVCMYSLTLSLWSTAFLGTGILTSIPGTFLLMTEMGVQVGVRHHGAVREPATDRRGIPWGFSSPLPLCGEGQSGEGAATPSGLVGGIGSGYPPPQSSPATGI